MVNVAAQTQSPDKVSRQWDPCHWIPGGSYLISLVFKGFDEKSFFKKIDFMEALIFFMQDNSVIPKKIGFSCMHLITLSLIYCNTQAFAPSQYHDLPPLECLHHLKSELWDPDRLDWDRTIKCSG